MKQNPVACRNIHGWHREPWAAIATSCTGTKASVAWQPQGGTDTSLQSLRPGFATLLLLRGQPWMLKEILCQ